MTYTINGKQWTEFDINKRCAEFIPVAINENQDASLKAKSHSVLINDIINTYEYNPCQNPSDTWPIIEKCWDELMEIIANDGAWVNWDYLKYKHNCTKLAAACICFIEENEA